MDLLRYYFAYQAEPPDYVDDYWNLPPKTIPKDPEDRELRAKGGPCTKGNLTMTGQVYYLDGTDRLPRAFFPPGKVSAAGGLHSVDLWGGIVFNINPLGRTYGPEGSIYDYIDSDLLNQPTSHNLSVKWDCCADTKNSGKCSNDNKTEIVSRVPNDGKP